MSFKHWKDLHEKGVIENHVKSLKLAHLKYAINQKLITLEQYRILRRDIIDQHSQSFTNYKPCTLKDFKRALFCSYINKFKNDNKLPNQDGYNGETEIPKKREHKRKIILNINARKNNNDDCTNQRTTSKKSQVSQKRNIKTVFSNLLRTKNQRKI